MKRMKRLRGPASWAAYVARGQLVSRFRANLQGDWMLERKRILAPKTRGWRARMLKDYGNRWMIWRDYKNGRIG